jgi:hypothetical protein
VPGIPGEPYFQKNRVLLGTLPLLPAMIMLCVAGWLVFRSAPEPKWSLEKTVIYCIGSAVGLIFLFVVIGALIYQR